MIVDMKAVIKSLKPKFIAKAMRTFDRATVVVVGVCWGAAIIMMTFALYSVVHSATAHRDAEKAAASEPILPKIVRKPMDSKDSLPLLDRLQHRYPGINFSVGNDQSMTISAMEGAKFREWLTVLGYVDVISPKYRWTIKELCVGKCGNSALMRAVLTGEKISFEAPSPKDRD